MGDPSVNGETNSLFLAHLTSYPVISQSLTHLRNSSYGAKSLALADEAHNRAKPVINSPYLKRLGPYLAKADSLGNEGLNRVDSRFPYLREDPASLIEYLSTPLRVAGDRKQRVMDLYESQYNRSGGNGYVAKGKALVTTGLKVTSEGLEWLSDYLIPEPEQHAGQNGTPAAGEKSYADAVKE